MKSPTEAAQAHDDALLGARPEETGGAMIAALVAAAVLLPVLVTLITIGLFLVGVSSHGTLLGGLGLGLVLWIIAGASLRAHAKAENVNPGSFGRFQPRWSRLKRQVEAFATDPASTDAAREEAKEHKESIDHELQREGLPWVLETSYIRIWERLHRAEEALIEVQSSKTVAAGALYDELRLKGSSIPNCEDLLNRLRLAAEVVDPSVRNYLLKVAGTAALPLAITSSRTLLDGFVAVAWSETLAASGGTPPYNWTPSAERPMPPWLTLGATGVLSGTPTDSRPFTFSAQVTDSGGQKATKEFAMTVVNHLSTAQPAADATAGTGGTPAARTAGSDDPERSARVALRNIRRAINEFRDERWNAFVVSRNRLAGMMFLTELMAYALVAGAVIMGATRSEIAAASAFYLVGAITGLLNRLNRELQTETGAEDYGLSEMRILSMSLVSGLVAVGGVILVTLLPAAAGIFAPTSTGSQAPAMPTWDGIFNLTRDSKNLVGLLVAAVFGLSPSLLFNRLQEQAEKYEVDLKNTEASQGPQVPVRT